MSAVEQWKTRIETHHAQSIRAQDRYAPSEDFWRPYASSFRADPRRTDDPVLDRLRRELRPQDTLMDVGGGAGRFALPLALRCRHVTVVDPSESMLQELREGAREAGIDNLTVVPGNWEDVEAAPAGVVLCSHVVYGVADIEPFIRKLDSHATKRVLLLMFADSPQSALSPFWKLVHEEERTDLPALPELVRVLWEMDIYPDVEMLETGGPHAFESREAAMEQLRRRLYVAPDTEQDRRLEQAARELLVEATDGLVVKGSRPRRQGLISWQP
jgi:SAM-dependent methyltransferase